MSTVVLTRFTTTDAYKDDASVIGPGMNLISGCEGVLGNYHGVSVKDTNVGFTAQVATSPEAFKNVVTNEKLFGEIMDKMKVARVSDDIEQRHFNAIGDPSLALAGPVTQISYLTLKDDTEESKATIIGTLTKFNELTEGKYNFGVSGENPKLIIVVAAWDSIEAHQERSKSPEALQGLKKMAEICDIDGPHYVEFKKI